MTTNRTKINIAHRGLWDSHVPENSLAAFKRCIDTDTPIELDVHLLRDGTLAVFHDDNLERMTGLDRKIKTCTYDDIKDLRLKGTDEHIPTLQEVLALVDGRVLLDIEIKFDVRSFKVCAVLLEQLKKYTGPFIIKSFSPFHMAWFRFKEPQYKRGLLVSSLANSSMPKFLKWLFFNMKFNFLCKPDFIAFDHRDLPNKKIDRLHEKGIPIYLWTIKGEDSDIIYDGIIYEKEENIAEQKQLVLKPKEHNRPK